MRACGAFVAAVLVLAGCAATIREEAGRAEARLSREHVARLLDRSWSQLDRGKRVFDIRLSGRVRVLNGEGAIFYETRPMRLRLDIFGPHATPVFSLVQVGDSMAVRLYEERRTVTGRVGDPAFARLTEGRSFTGHELLGALLGAYNVSALTGPSRATTISRGADRARRPAVPRPSDSEPSAIDTVGYDSGEEWVVALVDPARAHRFTYAKADSTLRTYRQERDGRPAYNVRFSDYRPVDGRLRPFRIELEDAAERRTVRVQVRSESFNAASPPGGFRLGPL